MQDVDDKENISMAWEKYDGDGRVKWVPCCHSIACSQGTDGAGGLQIWRVSADILDKQMWMADKEWSCSLAVGQGLTTAPI